MQTEWNKCKYYYKLIAISWSIMIAAIEYVYKIEYCSLNGIEESSVWIQEKRSCLFIVYHAFYGMHWLLNGILFTVESIEFWKCAVYFASPHNFMDCIHTHWDFQSFILKIDILYSNWLNKHISSCSIFTIYTPI